MPADLEGVPGWHARSDFVILFTPMEPPVDIDPPPPDRTQMAATGAAVGLGCSIVVTLVGLIGGGVVLDRFFDTAPTLTLIGIGLGLAAAGYELYELAQIGRRDRSAGPLGRQMAKLTANRATSPRPPVGRTEDTRLDGEE